MSKTSRSGSVSADSSSVGYDSEVDNSSFESPELKELRATQAELKISLAKDTKGVDRDFQKRILEVGHNKFVKANNLYNTSPDRPLVNNHKIDPRSFGSEQFTGQYFDKLNTYAQADSEVTKAGRALAASEGTKQSIDTEITKLTQEITALSKTKRTRITNFTRQSETLPTIPDSFAQLSVQQIRELQAKTGKVFNPDTPEEKVFEDKNKEALEKYIKLKEQLEAKKQEKLRAEAAIVSRKSTLELATRKRDDVEQKSKLDDVDKRMAVAIHQDPELKERLERSWKSRVALAQVEAKIYNIERELQREKEEREAVTKQRASVKEDFVVTDSPAQAAEDKEKEIIRKEKDGVSKKDGFVVVGSDVHTDEEKELEKKLKIKIEAQQKAIDAYVKNTGSTTKWKFQDLEKEVLEDNAGKRGFLGGRPKNIEQKRKVYFDYIKTLEENKIPVTEKQTAYSRHYEFEQIAKDARREPTTMENRLFENTEVKAGHQPRAPSATPTSARGASRSTGRGGV